MPTAQTHTLVFKQSWKKKNQRSSTVYLKCSSCFQTLISMRYMEVHSLVSISFLLFLFEEIFLIPYCFFFPFSRRPIRGGCYYTQSKVEVQGCWRCLESPMGCIFYWWRCQRYIDKERNHRQSQSRR